MKLFPKEIDFFEIFDMAATNLKKAAGPLVSLTENFENAPQKAKEIHEVEQDGDMLTHDIIRKLNKTFITPIDREDPHALASRLDDVLDLIWAASDRIALFKLKESTRESIAMAQNILMTVEIVQKAIKKTERKKLCPCSGILH